jgi:hypothetical protein
MRRTAFSFILLCGFLIAHSQESFFVLQKKGKTIQRFSVGSIITFQVKSGDWYSGDITQINADSFYLRQRSVRYTMLGADTVHFSGLKIAFTDILRMPRKTAMVYYRNDKPRIIRGHEKFAYVKNGLLFQLGGGGYAALNIAGSLFNHEPPFAQRNVKRLGIAALVFAIGEILHLNYHQHLRLGKKYQLKYIGIDSKSLKFAMGRSLSQVILITTAREPL